MQGQIAENTALANEAREKAEAAQRTADTAFQDAALANNRINGLDDYEIVKTIPVLFKVNSSIIDANGRKVMDQNPAEQGNRDEGGLTPRFTHVCTTVSNSKKKLGDCFKRQ